MSNKQETSRILRYQDGGLGKNILQHIKLIWNLLMDKRVNFFLKLMPVAALVYLIAPIDLATGVVLPFIGALDDAAVIWIGTNLFLSLCPESIVAEHMQSLGGFASNTWAQSRPEDVVLDGEARNVSTAQPE